MDDIRHIKKLKSQIKNIDSDIDMLKSDISNQSKELNRKQDQKEKLLSQIDRIENNNKVKVSEHAILRYLERVKSINIEEIKKEILSDESLKLIEQLGGNGRYPSKDFQIVLKNYTVTTVIK